MDTWLASSIVTLVAAIGPAVATEISKIDEWLVSFCINGVIVVTFVAWLLRIVYDELDDIWDVSIATSNWSTFTETG
jgi:xanthine/uracil permease